VPRPRLCRAGAAKQILAARAENDKGQKAVRVRASLDAASVMTVIKRERFGSVVGLVAGMYFEKGEFEGSRTIAVARALASRQGLWGKAAAMVAWSPHMGSIVQGLLASGATSSRMLAATVLATCAHGESLAEGPIAADRQRGTRKKKRDRQKPRAGRVDVEPFVATLLADSSSDVRELAVLAAAYARLEGVGETVNGLATARAPALEGARLLYAARVGWMLSEETVHKLLRLRVPVPKRFARLSPLLHDYDIRGNPLLYACQAVAAAGDKRFIDPVHELLDHGDLRVQIEAARAIERMGARRSVRALLKKLEARPPWPVKVALLSALGAIPAKESVEPLFRVWKTELGRFRQDAAYALVSIVPALNEELRWKWEEWWAEHGEDFRVDPEATRTFRQAHRVQDIGVEPLTDFYGGNVISNRAVFVLDTSMSMRGEKIQSLKLTMADTLTRMPDHMKFNIVDFGGVVRVMRPGALIDARHSGDARQLVDYMELSYGTRTFDAMEKATRLPEMDTIIYLSDGAPYAGTFEAWDRMVRVFDLYNRYRPVAIHCILYTGQAAKAPKAAKRKGKARGRAGGMQALADHNAGLMSIAAQDGHVEQNR